MPDTGGRIAPGRPRARWRRRLRLWGARLAATLRPLRAPVTLLAGLVFLVLTVLVIRWLQPARPPRLTVISGTYNSPSQAVRGWGRHDSPAIARLGSVLDVARAAPQRLNEEALRELTRQLIDLPPQRRWFFGPRTTELVYVNVPGIAIPDQAGTRLVPYLLPDDFADILDVERFPKGQALPVADLLQSLAQSSSDHKVLVLDCQRFEQFWPLGIVSNPFVEAVQQELLRQPERFRGISVLVSCAPGEVTHARAGEPRSVFGDYFIRGIQGAADTEGGNHDGRVTLGELVAYLQIKVPAWVQDQRGDRQNPLLMTDTVKSKRLTLAVTGRTDVPLLTGLALITPSPAAPSPADESPADASPATPTPADESPATPTPATPTPADGSTASVGAAAAAGDAPAAAETLADDAAALARGALSNAWRQYYELAGADPPPYVAVPYLWRGLEETLLGADASYREGDLVAVNEALATIPYRISELSAARANPARGKPAFSFPMQTLFDGPANDSGDQPAGQPAATDAATSPTPADARPDQPADDPSANKNAQNQTSPAAKALGPAGPSDQPAEASPEPPSPDDAVPLGPAHPLSRAELADLINQVRDGTQTALAAGTLLNRAPAGKVPLPAEAALVGMMAENWPVVESGDTLELAARAQQLVRGRYDAEQAAAPAGWGAPQVFRWIQPHVTAADRRQRLAEDAFFESASGSSQSADLDAAASLYATAVENSRVIAKAVALREQLLAEAPYLTRLAAARPDSSDDGFQQFVFQQTRRLLVGGSRLSSQLDAYPNSPETPLDAATIAQIEATGASLAQSRGELRRRIADEMAKLTTPGDPQPLATAASWRRAADLLSLPFACSDEPAATLSRRRMHLLRCINMPLAAAEDSAPVTATIEGAPENLLQSARAARAAKLLDLALNYLALAGEPQPTDLPSTALSNQSMNFGHSDVLAATWLRTYQAAVNPPPDADDWKPLQTSSLACRLLEPTLVAAAYPVFDRTPTQVLRRRQLADLVSWHALRRGEDFWDVRRNSAAGYGVTTAETYLAVADELFSPSTSRQADLRSRLKELRALSQRFDNPEPGDFFTSDPPSVLFRGTDTQSVRLTVKKSAIPAGVVRVQLEPVLAGKSVPAGKPALAGKPAPLPELANDAPPAALAVRPLTTEEDEATRTHVFEVSRTSLAGIDSSLAAKLFFRGHVAELRLPVQAVDEAGNLSLVYERQPPGAAQLVVRRDEIVRNPTNVLFVLDLSRSMGQLPENRLEILRAKLNEFAGVASQTGLVAGVRVFGHRYVWQPGNAQSEQAARTDTELLLPLEPFPQPDFRSVISQLKPVGESPLFQALLDARGDFDDIASGEKIIAVVSDGADNWARVGLGPGLDDLRAAYRNSGIVINAIGFQTDIPGFAQLEDIANFSGGKAVRAENANDLRTSIFGLSRVLKYIVGRQQDAAPPEQVAAGILRYPGPRLSLATGSYDIRVVDQDDQPLASRLNVRLLPDQLHDLVFRGGVLAYPPLNLAQDVATSDPGQPTIFRVMRADRVDGALVLQLSLVNRQDPAWFPTNVQLRIRPRGAIDVAAAEDLPSNVAGYYFPVWNVRIENWPEEVDHAEIEATWTDSSAPGAPASDRPCYVLDPNTGSFAPPLPAGFALTRRKLGALPAGQSRGSTKELLTLTLVAPEGYSRVQDWSFHFHAPSSFVRERYNVAAGVYTGQFAFFDAQPPATILLLGPRNADPATSTERSPISAKVNLRLKKINALLPAPAGP